MFFQQRSHKTPLFVSVLTHRPPSILRSQRTHMRGREAVALSFSRRRFLASLTLRAAPEPGGDAEPKGLAKPPAPPRGPTVGVVCERRGDDARRSSRVKRVLDAVEYADCDETETLSLSRLYRPAITFSSSVPSFPSSRSYASPCPEESESVGELGPMSSARGL